MFLLPMLDRPGATFQLVNADRGSVLAARLEPAFDSASRRRGLLGRDGLPQGRAIVIAPSNSIHMFFMRFAIDAVFVARDGRVVKTCANLRPWRIAAAWRAFAVVEGPAGMIEATGTQRGDALAVREIVPGEAGA
jgi:uncharacterized membrane protein (UPF0127 family)